MSKLIDDFIDSRNTVNGCGFFEGNLDAVKHSRTLTKNQLRGYKKYQKTPRAFRKYLTQCLNFVPGEPYVFSHRIDAGESHKKKGDPVHAMLDFLLSGDCADQRSGEELDRMVLEIYKDLGLPVPLFKADAEYVWRRMDKELAFKGKSKPQ